MPTIEQAATQWCPMVRTATPMLLQEQAGTQKQIVGSTGGINADVMNSARIPRFCVCIADECAMWRWDEKTPEAPRRQVWHVEEDIDEEDLVAEPARHADVPKNATWVPVEGLGTDGVCGGYWTEPTAKFKKSVADSAATRRGHCGIAGRVEFS